MERYFTFAVRVKVTCDNDQRVTDVIKDAIEKRLDNASFISGQEEKLISVELVKVELVSATRN